MLVWETSIGVGFISVAIHSFVSQCGDSSASRKQFVFPNQCYILDNFSVVEHARNLALVGEKFKICDLNFQSREPSISG